MERYSFSWHSISTRMDDVSIIEQCTEESDLGVTFKTDLSFCHINNAIHKA